MFAKTFRNTLIASSLLVGASLLAGPAALAEDITGNIPSIRSVVLSPSTVSINTDAEMANAIFGSLFIRDNNPGWQLTVASANGSKLVNGLYEIPYTGLTVGAVNAVNADVVVLTTPNTPDQLFANQTYSDAVSTGVSVNLTATIAENARQGLPTGNYTDTLTFVMAAP